MFILSSSKEGIYESDCFERILIIEKPDAFIVSGFISEDKKPSTLGKYADRKEAQEVLYELFFAISGGQTHFEMPDSRIFHEQWTIYDARTKRKGGS